MKYQVENSQPVSPFAGGRRLYEAAEFGFCKMYMLFPRLVERRHQLEEACRAANSKCARWLAA